MVSQKVTEKWDRDYEKKKEKKKKVGSAPIGRTSMLTFPLFAIQKDDAQKKKGSHNNCVSQKCKPFLGVLVSTSMSASLPATGACKNKIK
jgi:hypothetical protein